MSKSIFPHKKEFIISIHVIAWLLIFVIPIFFYSRSDDNQWVIFWWKNVCTPISFMIVFYVNYCWLIEKYVFANRLKSYITHNLVLIALLCGLNYCWQNYLTPDIQPRSVRLQEKIELLEKEIKELKQSESSIIVKATVNGIRNYMNVEDYVVNEIQTFVEYNNIPIRNFVVEVTNADLRKYLTRITNTISLDVTRRCRKVIEYSDGKKDRSF